MIKSSVRPSLIGIFIFLILFSINARAERGRPAPVVAPRPAPIAPVTPPSSGCNFPCSDGTDCVIARNVTASLCRNVNVGTLTIDGTLRCDSNVNPEIKAETIVVNGRFECGTASAPYQGKLKISLKHYNRFAPPHENYRGLVVARGGELHLHGSNAKSGFLKLDGTVGPQATRLLLSEAKNWATGDRLVLASTSYEPNESEEFFISGLSGREVSLNTPTGYRHHGETQTYFTQSGNKVLDERAEVANLTRNILIQAEGSVPDERGGHVMVHRGGRAFLDSVEFFQMGQAGLIGRYPIHWHMAGNVRGQYIKNSSIHRSWQRCVVIHDTNELIVENNVCFNFKGHGFMLEDGTEQNNKLNKNLAVFAQFPSLGKVLRASEDPDPNVNKELDRFPPVSSFWISHPNNTVTNNVASGSVGSGFWNSFDGRNRGVRTLSFENNIAHTALVGHTWDGAEKVDRKIVEPAVYKPDNIPVFRGIQAFKNKRSGIYYRGSTADFENAILEGNRWSLFLAFNQRIKNSLVVGEYKGNSCQTGLPDMFVGIILYDGPWELDTIDFIDFHHSPNHMPIKTVGGVDKWINYSRKLSFYPEPSGFMRLIHRDFSTTRIDDMWMDYVFANGIRDRDGTLSQFPGERIILPSSSITRHSGCPEVQAFKGMVSCPGSTRVFMVRAFDTGAPHPYRVVYDVIRDNDWTASALPSQWQTSVRSAPGLTPPLFSKTLIISDPAFLRNPVYRFRFPAEAKRVELRITSERAGEQTPELKIEKEGNNKVCSGKVTTSQESPTNIHSGNRALFIGKGSLFCNW